MACKMLNNNRTVLVVIVLFAIAGLIVGGYFAWRLDIFGLSETQVKGEIEVVKTVNETEMEKVTAKETIDEDKLTEIEIEQKPDGTKKERIKIHDKKHMEHLLELTKLKHRHEMERYAAIIGGTLGPFGLFAAAALISWICISRKKNNAGGDQRQNTEETNREEIEMPTMRQTVRDVLKEIEEGN